MDYTELEKGMQEYRDYLRSFLMTKCKDEQWMEEVFAETCLRAVRFWGSFKGGNFKAWLFQIGLNTINDTYRRRRRYADTFYQGLEDVEEPPAENSAEELVVERDNALEIQQALCKVDHNQRVLLQDWLAGVDYKEMAAKYGINMGTVKTRISRGRAIIEKGRPARSPRPAWFKQWLEQENK